jgi:hypothetical protein
MGYLQGRIQTKNLELMHLLFSAFYRSMLIFFMTPLYAAGAITEKEIDALEVLFLRSQFGLKGDVKNENISKVMNFFATPTSKAIAKMGSAIRHQLRPNHLAPPKKSFQITKETTEEDLIQE